MDPARILVVGSGGREHALAWRLAADPHAPHVLAAPGNDGMGAACERLAIEPADGAALARAARERAVDLVVIGPETALAAGAADALAAAGVPVFGPSRAAARVESSKWFAKAVCRDAGVRTARAGRFTDADAACAALDRFGPPWVVKADGLAAGKGVCVTESHGEAVAFVRGCLEGGRFGAAGAAVVLEEFLAGEEASVMAVCDGERCVLLPAARDHKRAFDGDRGPNTGGMGAYAPTPHATPAVLAEVQDRIVRPVLRVLATRGTPFRGLLYCGLALGPEGPAVIEFNARFGDPETQAVVPLVGGRFAGLLASAAAGALDADALAVRPGAAVSVALVDARYPEGTPGGGRITGLEALAAEPDLHVFHAGTRRDEGAWAVSGGRAAYVTAVAGSVDAARARALAAIGRLGGGGWRYRSDIAAGAGAPAAGRS